MGLALAFVAGCGGPPEAPVCFPLPAKHRYRVERSSLTDGYRGLGDLDGARLTVASDPADRVTVREGQLTARVSATTAGFRGVPLSAVALDGRAFRVEVVSTAVTGRTERVELLAGGRPVCPEGKAGVFVSGRWDASGAHLADPGLVTYSCSDGVIAKCVDWGYAPWVTGAELHAACTRLARADYCGDGVSWTLEGTTLDVYDALGVRAEPPGSRLEFEAAWTSRGAACLSRTRYDVRDAAGDAIVPWCRATLPACSSLDEAAQLGAVLAQRSLPTSIAACE